MVKWFGGLLVAFLLLGSVPAFAGSVPAFTGPAGTNPSQAPASLPDLNTLINNLNLAIAPGFTPQGTNFGIFTGGGMQIGVGAGSTLTITVAPASVTSLQIKGFIQFMASNGLLSFIPFWQ